MTGLFEQGNGESPSGEFGELRAYLITKLMWNPDLDAVSYTHLDVYKRQPLSRTGAGFLLRPMPAMPW